MDDKTKKIVEESFSLFFSFSKMEDKDERNLYIKTIAMEICETYGLNPVEFIDGLNQEFKRVANMETLPHKVDCLAERDVFNAIRVFHDIDDTEKRETTIREFIEAFCTENVVSEKAVVLKMKKLLKLPSASSFKIVYQHYLGKKLDRIMRLDKRKPYRIKYEDVEDVLPELKGVTQADDDDGPSL